MTITITSHLAQGLVGPSVESLASYERAYWAYEDSYDEYQAELDRLLGRVRRGRVRRRMSELSTNEVGCQINLATGRHFGECKGTCKPQAPAFSDMTHDDLILARIEALEAEVVKIMKRELLGEMGEKARVLEAQVRELEELSHVPTFAERPIPPLDNDGKLPEPHQAAKADFQRPDARAALASAAEAAGIPPQDVLDNVDNAPLPPDNYGDPSRMGEVQTAESSAFEFLVGPPPDTGEWAPARWTNFGGSTQQ